MSKRYFGSIFRRRQRQACPGCRRETAALKCPGCGQALRPRLLGHYYVAWTDAKGHRHVAAAGPRQRDAERVLEGHRAEKEVLLPPGRRRRQDPGADARTSASLGALRDAILAVWKGTLAAGTMRHRPTFLDRWSRRLGEVPVAAVSPLDVRRCVNRMGLARLEGGEGLAASSIQSEVAVLSSAFTTLRRDLGLPLQNPCVGVKLPKIHQRVRPNLRPDQVRTLLASCAPSIADQVVVLAEAGLRPAEVFRLTAGEVSRDLGLLRLERTKTYQTRSIVMTPLVRAALERALYRMRAERDGEDPPAAARVFPLSENAFRKHFRRAVDAAQLKDVSPYTLRHSFASAMLEAGAPVSVVRDALGHANLRTTDRYTRSLSDDAQRRAIDAFVRARGTLDGAAAAAPPPEDPPVHG